MTNRQKRKGWELCRALELSDTSALRDASSLSDYLRCVRLGLKFLQVFMFKCSSRPIAIPAKDLLILWEYDERSQEDRVYFTEFSYTTHYCYSRPCNVKKP
jgi:hypothetical protein